MLMISECIENTKYSFLKQCIQNSTTCSLKSRFLSSFKLCIYCHNGLSVKSLALITFYLDFKSFHNFIFNLLNDSQFKNQFGVVKHVIVFFCCFALISFELLQ